MKIAAIYDIHGNLPALEAVLKEIQQSSIDLLMVGGDVASGPMPRETLELLMALKASAVFLRGNADREVVACFDGGGSTSNLFSAAQETSLWTARQLERRHRDFLASFVEKSTFAIDGLGDVHFCHGSPRSDEEMITAATPHSDHGGGTSVPANFSPCSVIPPAASHERLRRRQSTTAPAPPPMSSRSGTAPSPTRRA